MTKKHKEFLRKLADLCEQYNAGFAYTAADDGIHISINGEDIFIGYMFDAVKELRDQAAR